MKITTYAKIIGDVASLVGKKLTVVTKNFTVDRRTKETVTYVTEHPVFCADEDLLKKIKVGKKIKFIGIITETNRKAHLVLDPATADLTQTKLKDRYHNEAGIRGDIVYKSHLDIDPEKRPKLTLGMAEAGTSMGMIYAVIWRQAAREIDNLLTGFKATAQMFGRMHSRVMTGPRYDEMGDNAPTAYELLVPNKDQFKILSRVPIEDGFDSYVPSEGLMALEFDDPDPIVNPNLQNLDDVPVESDDGNNDVPF